MYINVKQRVNIPKNFYCKGCLRKERDIKGQTFCGLFNKFIYIHNGEFLKCRECVNALYNALESEA